MGEKLIQVDVVSLFILAMILISQFSRKMSRGTTNKIFITLVVITLLSGCADIWAVTLDNMKYPDLGVRQLSHFIFLLIYNTIPPFFLMYVISLSSAWAKITAHKASCALLILPYAAVVVLLILNFSTGCVFSFENGVFVSQQLSFLTFLVAGVYLIVTGVYLIRFHKLISKRETLALFLMIPLMGGVVIVRLLAPETMVMVFSTTAGLLIFSVMIQRPEKLIDSITGLNKYIAYADVMKKNFLIGNHVCVIMINIANYSSLYKMLGYDKTRALLRTVSRRILEQNRIAKSHGTAYYLEQGKFRLVINSYNLGTADKVAQLINEALCEPVTIEKSELSIMACICAARCPEDISSFRSLMAFGADFHLKLPYKGEVIRADESTVKRMVSLLSDVDDIIDRAIANHGFHVYYQPIYSVEKKKFISAEALLRLIDENKGFISPEVFIPAAEKSGAIHKIGDIVLEEVCRFIASEDYKKLGLEYIEINLSVSQCMRSGLSEHILKIMNKYGVTPDQINLEITESAASYDQNVMTDNLNQLNSAGISFSLDDYGTGYSNMYRIAALPLKIVKLDKSFVNNQNSKMMTILHNTVRMIKDLNMEIVVEGIETEDMVKKFSDLQCDFIQGFYFSKPVPQAEFVLFIERSNQNARFPETKLT